MRHSRTMVGRGFALAAALYLIAAAPVPALAQKKIDPDGLDEATVRRLVPEFFQPQLAPGQPPTPRRGGDVGVEALPDIDGPGAVLTVGRVVQKVTNWGHIGNLFTNRSSDPSSQWPGASAIEYLSGIRFSVGAVNPTAVDPTAVRRVSYLLEWRPKTLDPEDKIYRGYDGIINGSRFVNDDGDIDPFTDEQIIDEDFLDGRDTDGDGLIDEDYAAVGQQMFSFTVWDNTQEAINTTFNEKHVPLGLECRQRSWAYSLPGFQDFNVHNFEIFNRSGHVLDSVFVGFLSDMDCGPLDQSSYWSDDFDIPTLPSGLFKIPIGQGDYEIPDLKRLQLPHDPALDRQYPPDQGLCPEVTIRVNGFSIADDNGDEDRTPGIPTTFLIDYTKDPLGISGPSDVRFSTFRSFTSGTPYASGGHPQTDHDKFDMFSKTENLSPETGFVNQEPGETKGDYLEWFVVGPWRNLPADGRIEVTIGFGVAPGTYQDMKKYPADYQRYQAGLLTTAELADLYPPLANVLAAHIAYEGIHEIREGYPRTDYHGRETPLRVGRGEPAIFAADCRDVELGRTRLVNDLDYTWFDFDCDYCTGVWDYDAGSGSDPRLGGLFHKTWNSSSPPPSPSINVASQFNFTDNPLRTTDLTPAGDAAVTLAWDNLSEVTPDPKTTWLDFRGYRLWKVADWTRPVGSPGPAESDWQLLGEFRLFDYVDGVSNPIQRNYSVDSTGTKHCPLVFIPNYLVDPETGRRDSATVPICLDRGDLWDHQSGEIITPDTTIDCVRDEFGDCQTVTACLVQAAPCSDPRFQRTVTKYPLGRYKFVDREVKNGFIYFYSITAFDSTFSNGVKTELSGRRSAVEAEGVVPQISSKPGKGVWVVPNPYRGYARIQERPSAWDLTPNASDPTGTHIDFMGLPNDKWTIKIFTVSGDLVVELHSDDPVNDSVRSDVKDDAGNVYAGYNRQQDNPRDGQARWNLITRNGQDIVSGIYLFSVESKYGTERGKFVVIR